MKYEVVELGERHFVGLKKRVNLNKPQEMKISDLWHEFMQVNNHIPFINEPFIGLETYDEHFDETKEFDYFAMGQVAQPTQQKGFFNVTLPKGKYIKVEISVKQLFEGVIPKVYEFVKELGYEIDCVLDYEEYPIDVNMSNPESKLFIVLKLK